ncbi:heavy-metal-associated domain-containing protein [bacterium]|nr:heavy-metal-associated domain-containing protein [bacterium]
MTTDSGINGTDPQQAQLTAVLAVTGMHCGGCAGKVKAALLELDGVSSAEVSHIKGSAVVSYDPQKTSVGALSEAVKAAGYSASAAA